MGDPPRLATKTGSPEALLLATAQVGDPPAHAEEELWRRLQAATALTAAGATAAIAAHEAASVGAKIAGKVFWLSVLKWGAVVAIAAPVAGVVAHRALARHAPPPVPVAPMAGPIAPVTATESSLGQPEVRAVAPSAQDFEPTSSQGTRVAPVGMSVSALRAESRLLESARAKLAAGDSAAALEDVAKLAAQFPHGRLIPEREVLAIDALEARGDRAPARARALAFLAQFPSSPYAARLRQRFQP